MPITSAWLPTIQGYRTDRHGDILLGERIQSLIGGQRALLAAHGPGSILTPARAWSGRSIKRGRGKDANQGR